MIQKNIKYSFSLLLGMVLACSTPNRMVVASSADPIEKRVDSIMNLMTLDEKIGQLNQYNGFWDITGPEKRGSSGKKI